jgi:hypothetical protein
MPMGDMDGSVGLGIDKRLTRSGDGEVGGAGGLNAVEGTGEDRGLAVPWDVV